jgi:acyl carrier protein
MMNQELIEALKKYIVTEILKQPDRNLDPDEALISSGVIDSFSLVDLALYVEDNFNVIIDDSELNPETFDNLNSLSELISARQK